MIFVEVWYCVPASQASQSATVQPRHDKTILSGQEPKNGVLFFTQQCPQRVANARGGVFVQKTLTLVAET